MAGIITDMITNFDYKKVEEFARKTTEYWKKFTGAYKYPNGLLGSIPIYIESFELSTSNSITSNKTFKGIEVADNISVEPYSISLTIVAFTEFYIDIIEMHQKVARESNGKDGITALYYNKVNTIYGPLAIENFSFRNDAKATFLQLIDIELKYMEIRKFITDENGVITTATLGTNDYFKNQEVLESGMPINLFDELSRTDKFKEYSNAINNKINVLF